jgi:hypothetical protein
MAISVNEFRVSAGALGAGDEIHLKKNKQGVAMGGWERFKISVSNFFSFKSTDVARNKQVINTFLDSIRQEYGRDLGNLARSSLLPALQAGQPLTARMVTQTLTLMEGRGGQHWLRNQQLIGELSGPSLFRTATPPFSGVLQEVHGEVMTDARAKGLPPAYLERLSTMYTPPERPLDISTHTQVHKGLSTVVRTFVSQEGQHGMGYREIDPDRAREIALDRTRLTMVQQANTFQNEAYSETHGSFQDAFNAMARARGLEGVLPPETARKLMREVEDSFTTQLAVQTTILTPEQVGALRQAALTSVFDRQREKLDNIGALGLAPGPGRDQLVEFALGTRKEMNRDFFDRAVNVSARVRDGLQAIRNAPNPEAREVAVRELGRIFGEQTRGMSGDDQDVFAQMVRHILTARSPDDARLVGDLMREPGMVRARDDMVTLSRQGIDARTEDGMVRIGLISNAVKLMTEFSPRDEARA